jgi:hypothetical protein
LRLYGATTGVRRGAETPRFAATDGNRCKAGVSVPLSASDWLLSLTIEHRKSAVAEPDVGLHGSAAPAASGPQEHCPAVKKLPVQTSKASTSS